MFIRSRPSTCVPRVRYFRKLTSTTEPPIESEFYWKSWGENVMKRDPVWILTVACGECLQPAVLVRENQQG